MPVFLIIFVVRKDVSSAAVKLFFNYFYVAKGKWHHRFVDLRVLEVINFVCYPTIIFV